jgi:purine-nucleoside phosphorylase
MKPVHVVTAKGNIAENVIMPGDPLRAKYIAEKFLENPVLINSVRNMLGYTGTYKGKKVTVIGSGMGIPSMGIYSYELYYFYDVKNIIRIGTAGALNPNVKIGDVVLSTGCYSESSFAFQYGRLYDKYIDSSIDLNLKILKVAKDKNINVALGPTLTSDVFDVYVNIDHVFDRCPIVSELVACEMEGFGLLHVARMQQREATVMMTVVDSKYDQENAMTPEQREKALDDMIELALESI